MRLFSDAIQVVLQKPEPGGVQCECFGNVPSPDPALIAVVPCGGTQAENDARRIARTLSRTLHTLSSDAQPIQAPCARQSAGAVGCHAHRESSCRRVLVAVGDGTVPLDDKSASQHDAIDHWVRNIQSGNSRFVVLPALPETEIANSTALLGQLLQPYNACFWSSDPAEIVPAVLRAAGITANDFRAFISYRRSDGQTIADQLFDALNKRNYDVFLDRFRIDPGVHVQDRIVEELANRSMVVLLETNDLPQSHWVAQEIAYAIANRLDILAVNVDKAPKWPAIGARRRIQVRAPQPSDELHPDDLARVVRRIALAHGAAMVRRRNYLRQTLRDSLLIHGANRQSMTSDGFLEAYPKLGAPQPYRAWLTPRPAEVFDFQTARVKGGFKPVVVAPAALLTGMRQAAMRWVANVAAVRYVDESDIPILGADMAKGQF